MADALVTPSVLSWARERIGYSTQVASQKLNIKEGDLISWERGTSRPSFSIAKKMAKEYNQPLASFYLPHPPEQRYLVEDFRSLDVYQRKNSPELSILLENLNFRQSWLREYLFESGEEKREFIGSATIHDSIDELAAIIRLQLHISFEEQAKQSDERKAWNYWVLKAEQQGIYISKGGKIDSDEARGIALSDNYAPFIYVNSKDSYGSRQFTLAHELVHLWLDRSGISNLNPSHNQIEVFCNNVASRVLIPEKILMKLWNEASAINGAIEKIELIAKRSHLSNEHIARRIHSKNLISETEYNEIRKKYHKLWKERKMGGGDYYRNKLHENGVRYTYHTLEAYNSGKITLLEAGNLLNVKTNQIKQIFSKLGAMRKE